MDVTVKFERAWPYQLQSSQYDIHPRYVVFGGLLFQPLSRDFLDAYQIEDLRVRYISTISSATNYIKERPEVVVLSAILPDPINTYDGEFKNGIVDEVNGAKIKGLNDLADAFAKPATTT